MKKIGIITHYYKSKNYGGNLQAFALTTFLNKSKNIYAEQISFLTTQQKKEPSIIEILKDIKGSFKEKTILYLKSILFFYYKKIEKICIRTCDFFLKRKYSTRNRAISSFNLETIPHSKEIYSNKTLNSCDTAYDVFITGSDQVWAGCDDAYALNFTNKAKLSYAASISQKEITEYHKSFLQKALTDYKAISVRDITDKLILSELTDKKIDIVLDPVFLLSKENWNNYLTQEKKYKENYILCYFLGDSRKYKSIAKDYAKKRNCKIVTFSHFKDNENSFVFNDLFFGDYKPFDVSPFDFITLIRDAECVITDSFHGTVFSIIFNKEFFVFDRESKYGDMSSRLLNLLKTFNLIERFCNGNEKEKTTYLLEANDINYNNINEIYTKLKEYSESFLTNILDIGE